MGLPSGSRSTWEAGCGEAALCPAEAARKNCEGASGRAALDAVCANAPVAARSKLRASNSFRRVVRSDPGSAGRICSLDAGLGPRFQNCGAEGERAERLGCFGRILQAFWCA